MFSRKLFFTGVVAVSVFIFTLVSSVHAQTCCDPDVVGQGGNRTCPGDPDELVQITDLLTVVDCVLGHLDPQICPDVFDRCDVNCDGVVDWDDVGYVHAAFINLPDPCNTPVGACCSVGGDIVTGCIVTTASFCEIFLVETYLGDDTTCTPSLCDCNNNGIPDGDDIANATSTDCNLNGNPDECENGACCFDLNTCEGGSNPGDLCSANVPCSGGTCTGPPAQACANISQASCEGLGIDGLWQGPCQKCPKQNVAIITEGDGSIFIHVIGPPTTCPGTGGSIAGLTTCTGPPFFDAWKTAPGGVVCHNFGVVGSPAIPADFFGPGSDPFTGTICLNGLPLGPTAFGDFGDADTLITRTADPFDRCDLASATQSTVDIEIVALSLVSAAPITVTFNGGQNPQDWDAAVDLSPGGLVVGTPPSSLTAIKTAFDGGTYTSILYVQPRFTFTKVGVGTTQVLDTGLAGMPAIELSQTTPMPWVTEIDENLGATVDLCSAFHPGIESTVLFPAVDCNSNGLYDDCDISLGSSLDANLNGIPDECDMFIPATSTFGLVIMALLIATIGTILVRRSQSLQQAIR